MARSEKLAAPWSKGHAFVRHTPYVVPLRGTALQGGIAGSGFGGGGITRRLQSLVSVNQALAGDIHKNFRYSWGATSIRC